MTPTSNLISDRHTAPFACSLLLALLLFVPSAWTSPAPANPAVSAAEVSAFMESCGKNPQAMQAISANPKRVPLLLEAIRRQPDGPWVRFLQGFCFQADRASVWHLAPSNRANVYIRASEYLATAKTTVAKALTNDPQNRALKDNFNLLAQALTLAQAEYNATSNRAGPSPETGTASNSSGLQVPASEPRKSRQQVCVANLKQISIAKQMWQTDEEQPDTATPTVADVTRYLPYHQYLKCPDGGIYTIGKLSEKPRCSKPGHALPDLPK